MHHGRMVFCRFPVCLCLYILSVWVVVVVQCRTRRWMVACVVHVLWFRFTHTFCVFLLDVYASWEDGVLSIPCVSMSIYIICSMSSGFDSHTLKSVCVCVFVVDGRYGCVATPFGESDLVSVVLFWPRETNGMLYGRISGWWHSNHCGWWYTIHQVRRPGINSFNRRFLFRRTRSSMFVFSFIFSLLGQSI